MWCASSPSMVAISNATISQKFSPKTTKVNYVSRWRSYGDTARVALRRANPSLSTSDVVVTVGEALYGACGSYGV